MRHAQLRGFRQETTPCCKMRLTRRETMKRASGFAMVKAAGTSEAGRFLVLSALPRTAGQRACPKPDAGKSASRFGIITTKRLGHAVVRNLMRRRVREILREHGDALSTGLDVVIVVRNRAPMASYAALEKDFQRLVPRLLGKLPSQSC